jgi:hypothetical protein
MSTWHNCNPEFEVRAPSNDDGVHGSSPRNSSTKSSSQASGPSSSGPSLREVVTATFVVAGLTISLTGCALPTIGANVALTAPMNHNRPPVPPPSGPSAFAKRGHEEGINRAGGRKSNSQRVGRSSADATSEPALADRAFDLMDYLVQRRGWDPAAAAIAAGNAEQESSIRSDGPMGDPSVPGGSWGLFQWNRTRLERLKATYGDRWRTDAAQFEYFADEVEGTVVGGTAIPAWPQQRDLSRAAAISRTYEGYGDNSTGARVANAEKWLDAYRNRPDQAATTPASPPTGANPRGAPS